jgi:hypothetical protein
MLKHRQEKLQHSTALHQPGQQRLKAGAVEVEKWASAHCYLQYSSGLMSSTQPEMLLTQHFL